MSFLSGLLSFLAILLSLAFGAAVKADTPANLPPGGQVLLPADARFKLVGTRMDLGSLQTVAVKGQPFSSALRMSTKSDPGVEWGVQAQLITDFDLGKGDLVLARFWMRCVDSMTGEGVTSLVVEQNHEPYAKAVDRRVGAAGEWRHFDVPFVADRDYAAGRTQLVFRGGFDRQTIEIADVQLIRFPSGVKLEELPATPLTYPGHEADAPWRKAALDRIERIRKGDFTLHVVDDKGAPRANVTIHATLRRHAFGFGSCVTADLLTGTSPDARKYQHLVETCFNRVVFENDMKWPAMEHGVPAKLDAAVEWLRARGIAIRGHNLQWPSWEWSPRNLRASEHDPAQLRKLCEERITSAVSHFKGKLIDWDVINEPYNNTDLLKILGNDVMVDWLKLAREADPQCRLFVNDFGIFDGGPGNAHRAATLQILKDLQAKGAPLDGIGIQSHFGTALPPPTQLLDVLDTFATLKLPITSTEVSFNLDDPQLQADYLRDYMTALFSHPSVDAILLWGFWENAHWRPTAALWTKDWTPKPAAEAWLNLVAKEWSTDVTLTTDANGVARFRGFYGDYDVTTDGATKQVALSKPNTESTIRPKEE